MISPTDPAARYTASANSVAGYAYSDNYLDDLKHAVIVDVEATTTIRQAEVGAAKTMLDRTAEQFDLTPSRLVADGGYGSADMVGWLVDERGIEPHVNLIDKSERTDGTFSRSDFTFDTALSHQPFLLLITWPFVRPGFNKFNGLANRQCPARDPFLARCDNAQLAKARNRRPEIRTAISSRCH